jgi:hypothetical protein
VIATAEAATTVGSTGTCTFTFSLPVTAPPVQTDAIAFQNETAANEVARAGGADVDPGPSGEAVHKSRPRP